MATRAGTVGVSERKPGVPGISGGSTPLSAGSSGEGGPLRFQVLGPLKVEHGGRLLTPNAAKQRQVLAMLLLNANKPIRMSEFIHELWGLEPPVSAVNTLQTYILRIRRILDVAAADRGRDQGKTMLVTHPGGYLLQVEPGQLDVHTFDEIIRAAATAKEREDHVRTSRLLQAALRLYRGPILSDVRIGARLAVHVGSLEEAVLCAREQRIEADLKRGCHRELVSELTGLAVEYRTNERLHGQLMIALYESGRRVDALEVYQRLRKTLVDELGIEPTDWLDRIQHGVLTADLDVAKALTERSTKRHFGTNPLQVTTALP
jgi:DNA-binding SARP family transcriptional activator